jgi:hypothetical protein
VFISALTSWRPGNALLVEANHADGKKYPTTNWVIARDYVSPPSQSL